MIPPEAQPDPERDPSLEAALACYLSSVLDMAGTAESLELERAGPEEMLVRLRDFASRFQDLAKSGDLARLSEQADALRGYVESIENTRRETVARLLKVKDEFHTKLRQAERLAAIDPLTGVANRREFDRQVAARIAAASPFCVLLFDLNQFKSINDQHGHLAGDKILKRVGDRLNVQVRARDFVARWGGDEFVVILECALAQAAIRSREIARRLNGPYRVPSEKGEIRVEILVSVGAAEYVAPETPEQLFARVDASMYRDKNSQSQP